MGEIVAAFGAPHTPHFPDLVARLGPECETARLYRQLAQSVSEVQPDVLIVFDSDHLNTFFFDNLPTFSVGAAEKTSGPNDGSKMPRYEVPIHHGFAQRLHSHGVESGFDLSLTQEFEIDHSILVPLHFLTPNMDIPIVPVFINGLSPPLPAAKRCHALGLAIRDMVERWPQKTRVAVLASGSFSLEVGGPRIPHGQRSGVPDPDWCLRVQGHLEKATINDLLEEATSSRMLRAGNVGGELLNWIALLGVIGDRRPRFIESQLSHGHAYGVWRWD
jgi:Catalytic LigB subunit of aromatic ring-opening dioxygenase